MAAATRGRIARASISTTLLVAVAACSSARRSIGTDPTPKQPATVPLGTTTILVPTSIATSKAGASTTSTPPAVTAPKATTTTLGLGPCTVTPKDHDGVSANVGQRSGNGLVVRVVVEAPLCIRPDRELYAEVHVTNTTKAPMYFSTRMPGYVVVSDRTGPTIWSSPCLKDEQAPDQAFVVGPGEDQILAHSAAKTSPSCGTLPAKGVLKAEGTVFRCTDSTCTTRTEVSTGPVTFELA